MAMFLHDLPEQAENPHPPALAGEIVTETKLHRLRHRQLVDLAKAYGIDLPDGATKNEILPIMVTHERAGKFRQPPVSRYHLLHAEISHDQKMEPHQRAEREALLRQAEASERVARQGTPPNDARQGTPDAKLAVAAPKAQSALNILRQRAKGLGINSFGKNADFLKAEIAAEENRRAQPAAPPAVA